MNFHINCLRTIKSLLRNVKLGKSKSLFTFLLFGIPAESTNLSICFRFSLHLCASFISDLIYLFFATFSICQISILSSFSNSKIRSAYFQVIFSLASVPLPAEPLYFSQVLLLSSLLQNMMPMDF